MPRGDSESIKWSSKTVKDAADQLTNGAKSVTVNSKSEAEELFLNLYQSDGYTNTTGMDAMD